MIPSALERVEGWRLARERAGRILVALDFDGTLAPIVPSPAEARLPDPARAALERLARRGDTVLAIISGRALRDLKERVGIPGLYYAGNHGLEIEGPGVDEVHEEATRARPHIVACVETLDPILTAAPGSILEDKGLTISIHYRQVADPAAVERIRDHLLAHCAEEPALQIFEGKKVFEIRPAVDWDKGRATEFLLDTLARENGATLPALFVGDDRTDEDAFRALSGRGDGVIVAPSPPPDTAATSFVHSPAEVVTLLEYLAQ